MKIMKKKKKMKTKNNVDKNQNEDLLINILYLYNNLLNRVFIYMLKKFIIIFKINKRISLIDKLKFNQFKNIFYYLIFSLLN